MKTAEPYRQPGNRLIHFLPNHSGESDRNLRFRSPLYGFQLISRPPCRATGFPMHNLHGQRNPAAGAEEELALDGRSTFSAIHTTSRRRLYSPRQRGSGVTMRTAGGWGMPIPELAAAGIAYSLGFHSWRLRGWSTISPFRRSVPSASYWPSPARCTRRCEPLSRRVFPLSWHLTVQIWISCPSSCSFLTATGGSEHGLLPVSVALHRL
jgi:hypothetical protein